jgi:outer membrane protein
MNRNLTVLSVLGAALALSPFAIAQAPAAGAPPAAPTPAAPQAIPAKIAIINYEQVVVATNEGQVAAQTVQKKYEPKRQELEKLAAEVDSEKAALQKAGATLSDADRASKLRSIDTKEKQLNRDYEDMNNAGNADMQEALGKIAQKLNPLMLNYVQTNGFTILLDNSSQQSNVMWAVDSTNISRAVLDAYNKQSGVAAPTPQAPSAPKPASSTAKPAAKPAGK